jgi:hypothetical protein
VTSNVENPQRNLPALEVGNRLQRVDRTAEGAVELGADHDVARGHGAQ